jgi:hypothetical protein
VNASWIGGNSDWNTGTNWTPTGVPKNGANTYNDTINSGGTDYVNLDIASTITSLTLGGVSGSSTLNSTSGNALTITGAFAIGATGSLTLSGAGSNLTAGQPAWSGIPERRVAGEAEAVVPEPKIDSEGPVEDRQSQRWRRPRTSRSSIGVPVGRLGPAHPRNS